MKETKLNKWGYSVHIQHFPRRGEVYGSINVGQDERAVLNGTIQGKDVDVLTYGINNPSDSREEKREMTREEKREMTDVMFWALENHLKEHGYESVGGSTGEPKMAYFLKKHRNWGFRVFYGLHEVRKDLSRVIKKPRRWTRSRKKNTPRP